MKKVLFLIVMLSSTVAFSQNSSDQTARAKEWLKLNREITFVKVLSPEGRSAVDLVYQVFTSYGTIPELNMSNISSAEKAEIELFIARLNDILVNTPSWDQILAKKTEIENAGPQQPVFAGNVDQSGYYAGSGKFSRGSSTQKPVSTEQTLDSKPVEAEKVGDKKPE